MTLPQPSRCSAPGAPPPPRCCVRGAGTQRPPGSHGRLVEAARRRRCRLLRSGWGRSAQDRARTEEMLISVICKK
ncbi:unnamed protein product [Caretta caretta]